MQKLTKSHRVASLFLAARWVLVAIGFCAFGGAMSSSQVSGQLSAQSGGAAGVPATPGTAAPPVVITLDEAIARARASDPAYATSRANSTTAALDRSIARSALLPNALYHNQVLYTQPNGLLNQAGQGASAQPAPRFIANNAVREYASQLVVNETLGVAQFADLRRADAAASLAAAELEIARRGLVSTVVGLYYSTFAAEEKLGAAKRAADEAQGFTTLTQKLEAGREVAHADVVKATLQLQQRQRDLNDANLAAERSRLDLAVLLFPDPRTPYTLDPAAQRLTLIPSQADVEAAAMRQNPELRSALSAVRVSQEEVTVARAGYLPSLGLAAIYGIDAPQFAVNGPDGVHNLGYSLAATLDIPVWDWLATHDRVRQSEIRRDAARVALTSTQRQLVARLEEFYHEAVTASDQLASLDSSVSTAAESMRLVKLRYSGGEATALEVVDAENAFTAAEVARADGMVRYRVALANLQTLTGAL
jgi:outer membrane protein TolC